MNEPQTETKKRPSNPFRSMSSSDIYKYIVEQYLKKEPVDERAYAKISTPSGRGGFAYHSDNSWRGGPRMFVERGTLYSYVTSFPLAQWVDDGKNLIANADWSPSQDTTFHQRLVRDVAKKLNIVPALIPEAVLAAPRIDTRAIHIVATTADREIPFERRVRCGGEVCSRCHRWGEKPNKDGIHIIKGKRHYLGEVLFWTEERVPGGDWEKHYFVSGLDRNDDPSRMKFFLARVKSRSWPTAGNWPPTTVDDALLHLRPLDISDKALRQGEWFLDPVDAKLQRKLSSMDARYKVPIVSAKPEEQRKQFTTAQIVDAVPLSRGEKNQPVRGWGRSEAMTDGMAWIRRDEREKRTRLYRMGRHVAEREIVTDEGVFVRGKIQDQEHDHLDLGKRWHRVVRNLADGSWSMPEREGRPARVD